MIPRGRKGGKSFRPLIRGRQSQRRILFRSSQNQLRRVPSPPPRGGCAHPGHQVEIENVPCEHLLTYRRAGSRIGDLARVGTLPLDEGMKAGSHDSWVLLFRSSLVPPAPRWEVQVGEWFYRKGDNKHGPVDTASLREMAASGELGPSDLIWREGLAQWVPAGKAKGLFSTSASSAQRNDATPPIAAPAVERRAATEANGAIASTAPELVPTPNHRTVPEGPKRFALAGIGLGIATIVIAAFILRPSHNSSAKSPSINDGALSASTDAIPAHTEAPEQAAPPGEPPPATEGGMIRGRS